MLFFWVGRKGFMRGPCWFLIFLASILFVLNGLITIGSAIFGNKPMIDPLQTILVFIFSLIYFLAYIFLPKWWKKRRGG